MAEVIEVHVDGGGQTKTTCDLCFEVPENNALIEKPNSMIIEGRKVIMHRPRPLYICLECLTMEIDNI